jgi:hypothetical protein
MGDHNQTESLNDVKQVDEHKREGKLKRGIVGIGPSVIRNVTELADKPASVTNATANLADSIVYNIVYNF